MDDLTITRKCAEAMGITLREVSNNKPEHTLRYESSYGHWSNYWPLTDDAQAMQLVKKLKLSCECRLMDADWLVIWQSKYLHAADANLNRAVCLCVARMKEESRG